MRATIFLIHDKMDDQFIHAFADRLASRGFDTDADYWGLGPDESLVDKIFGEGLRRCAAFVVVVSRASLPQQWLKAELDEVNVRRIQDHVPIITLLLDDCIPSKALGSATVVEAVADRHSFDSSAALVGDIAYKSMYPTGGPGFDESLPIIEGLNRMQSMIIKQACEYLLERETDTVNPDRAFPVETWGWLSEEEMARNLAEVEQAQFIKVNRFLTGGYNFVVLHNGFEAFCNTYLENYRGILKQFAGTVLNDGIYDNNLLASTLKQPLRLINHIIDELQQRGMIRTNRFIDSIKVQVSSQSFRRLLWGDSDEPLEEGAAAPAPAKPTKSPAKSSKRK